jgi:hypothetical protein
MFDLARSRLMKMRIASEQQILSKDRVLAEALRLIRAGDLQAAK